MQKVLQFDSADKRYGISIKTVGDTLGMWTRFKGRIAPSTGRTADTYCNYTSSSEGMLQMWMERPESGRLAPKSEDELVTIDAEEGKVGKKWSHMNPVVFETGGKYHFLIKLNDVRGNAHIVHSLKSVTDGFDYIKTGQNQGYISGVIDFLNQPGNFSLRFEYIDTNGKRRQEFLTFEVVSPKLDTKHDLKEITRLIDDEYENYVYQYLSLTFQSQKLVRANSSDGDVWMSIFQSIVDRYINAVKYIEHHSNQRSVQRVYHHKAERIKRWNVKELEKFANRGEDADKYYYRNQVAEQTINTRENRFVKHTLQVISERLEEVFGRIEKKYGEDLSDAYVKQIKEYRDTFRQTMNNKFFRSIGKFEGKMQESQVLQQRAGYRNVYVCWQMLRSVFNLEEGSTQIGMRMIWKLYEVWCYLVMKRLICKILNIDYENDKVRLEHQGSSLVDCLEDEKASCTWRFYFDEEENRLSERRTAYAELVYQCRYKYDESAIEEHTLTIEQIPDIVLNIYRKDKITLTYLFDAKYRVSDDKYSAIENATDEPVRETLNTMHHYRDAILYGTMPERMDGIKHPESKEVIGGYILFPGRVGSEDALDKKYYVKSIKSVNIGAIPVMPVVYNPSLKNENKYLACGMLEEHLKKLLSERAVIAHIGKSTPQRGLQYTDDEELGLTKKWDRYKSLVFVQKSMLRWSKVNNIDSVAIGLDLTQDAMQIVKDFSTAKYVILTDLENNFRLCKLKEEPTLEPLVISNTCWVHHCSTTPNVSLYIVYKIDNPSLPLAYPKIDNEKIVDIQQANSHITDPYLPCIAKMSELIVKDPQ